MGPNYWPALTRKSTRTDFNFVWPDLKSSPPTKTWWVSAISINPGTSVFWGDPFIKEHWKYFDNEISCKKSYNSFQIQLTPSIIAAIA